MLSGGYGLRLFAGFAGLVLLMLIVSAVVFFSLFGGSARTSTAPICAGRAMR